MKNEGAGKGDSYRPVDRKKFSENYDHIFKKKPKKTSSSKSNKQRESS